MAHAFIGLPMLVTLLDPPGAQVRGVVSSVVPGKSLTLRNGMFVCLPADKVCADV